MLAKLRITGAIFLETYEDQQKQISCREKIEIFILFSKRMYIEKNNSHTGHQKIKLKIISLYIWSNCTFLGPLYHCIYIGNQRQGSTQFNNK